MGLSAPQDNAEDAEAVSFVERMEYRHKASSDHVAAS